MNWRVLIRWPFSRRKRQVDSVDCRFQGLESLGATTKMCGGDDLRFRSSVADGDHGQSDQFNPNNTTFDSLVRRAVEENERCGGASNNLDSLLRGWSGGFIGSFAHDGKFHCLKWDDSKGCYVPVEESRGAA